MAQQVNLSGALPLVLGFSEQQVHGLINIVHSVMRQYLTPSTPPPSTPSAPQEAQKEENEQPQKQEQQPLYQATVESTTESITKHSSMPDSKSTISTIPRLCTVRSSGDSAACFSNAILLAYLPGYTLPGYTLPGYIEHLKGLKATGQG